MIDHIAHAARTLAVQVDCLIKAAVGRRAGLNLPSTEIARRAFRRSGPGGDTIFFDGEPLIWIGAPEIVSDEGVINMTLKWRPLEPAAAAEVSELHGAEADQAWAEATGPGAL